MNSSALPGLPYQDGLRALKLGAQTNSSLYAVRSFVAVKKQKEILSGYWQFPGSNVTALQKVRMLIITMKLHDITLKAQDN